MFLYRERCCSEGPLELEKRSGFVLTQCSLSETCAYDSYDVFSGQIMPFSRVLECFVLVFGLAELLLLSIKFYVTIHAMYI